MRRAGVAVPGSSLFDSLGEGGPQLEVGSPVSNAWLAHMDQGRPSAKFEWARDTWNAKLKASANRFANEPSLNAIPSLHERRNKAPTEMREQT